MKTRSWRKFRSLSAVLGASLLGIFAGCENVMADTIDITTLSKNSSGQYVYTFPALGNDVVESTAFTYNGAENVTLYLNSTSSNFTAGRWRYQGGIAETGSGKVTVIWKTGAMRIGSPACSSGDSFHYSGGTTIDGGSWYLYDGSEFGSGIITVNNGANICSGWNNSNSSQIAFNNDIVLNSGTVTFRAGWGSTSFTPPSSITFNGNISGKGMLQFGGETGPGPIYIYGTNTYSGNTNISYNAYGNNSHTYYSGTPYALRCALFGIGTDKPFSTGTVTVTSGGNSTARTENIMFAFYTMKDGAAVNRTLTNNIVLKGYAYNGVQYDSNLYLLNDGAVNSASAGTVTLNTALSGTGTLHIQNKGFTVNLTGALGAANITGPTESGVYADININNSDNWLQNTGKLSGNLHITKNGAGQLRLHNTSSDMTGTVTLLNGNTYLGSGHEFGTATIYMGSKDGIAVLNNGGNYPASGLIATDMVLNNNIVFNAETTSYLRFYPGGGANTYLNGNLTGSGNVIVGKMYGYPEPSVEPSANTLYLNGNNTYTGSTEIAYQNDSVYYASGATTFGTGALTVTRSASLTYQAPTSGTSVAHTLANSSITLAKNMKLTVKNTDTTALSVTPKTVTFTDASCKLILGNTATGNAITVGSTGSRTFLSGNGTLDLTGTVGAKVYLTNKNPETGTGVGTNFNIVGASSAANKASVYYQTVSDHQYTGALTGNMDFTSENNQNIRFNHNYGTGKSFTGNTYLNNSGNIYLTYTDELGIASEGTAIYYNITGNLSNGGNGSASRPVINKDIVLKRNGVVRIGWVDRAGVTNENPCSITFNGDISGAYSLMLGTNWEPGTGRYYLNGNNSYSGGTIIGSLNATNTGNSLVMRTEYILGTNTAFGSKKDGITFVDSTARTTPVTIKLNSQDAANPLTFTYSLNIGDHIVSLGNFSENGAIFNSAITGNAGTSIYFGEFDYTSVYTYAENKDSTYDWANKQNAGKGLIQFNGTIGTSASNMNAVVNDKVLFGGTGTVYGELEIAPEGTLSLSKALNAGNDLQVKTLDLDGTVLIDISSLQYDGTLLTVTDSSSVDPNAEIIVNYTGSAAAAAEGKLIDFGSGVDFSDLNWTLNAANASLWMDGNVLMLSTGVPEPSAWLLGLLGFGGIFFLRRERNRG